MNAPLAHELAKPDNNGIMVSIVCTAYNHEAFISQALESFVTQKTSFLFEILVHDDASTDHTPDIIRRYENNYRNLFVCVYQKENQFSKRDGNIFSNIMLPMARGKYIAICEGDDYWTDHSKLQKQVEYLESHPECPMCFHNAMVEYSDSKKSHLFRHLDERDYAGHEFYPNWIAPTASIVFRSAHIPFVCQKIRNPAYYYNDVIIILSLCEKGKAHCINSPMSVYRRHAGGLTQRPKTIEILGKLIRHAWGIHNDFDGKYATSARVILAGLYQLCALDDGTKYLPAVKYVTRAFMCSKVIGMKAMVKLGLRVFGIRRRLRAGPLY